MKKKLTKEQKIAFEKAWNDFKLATKEDGIRISKADFLEDWIDDCCWQGMCSGVHK